MFEAVVNSIQAIDERGGDPTQHSIRVIIERDVTQPSLLGNGRKGAAQAEIIGFKIVDDGIGFDDENFASFTMLDSDYKQERFGCHGVGRLQWLKAFSQIEVSSTYRDRASDAILHRDFRFSAAANGVTDVRVRPATQGEEIRTVIHLDRLVKHYYLHLPKKLPKIAEALFEHILWNFLRASGVPDIQVIDADGRSVALRDLYSRLVVDPVEPQPIVVKDHEIRVRHLRLRDWGSEHIVSWCANDRVVVEERLARYLPGVGGRLVDNDRGEFTYACFVTGSLLDERVRSERAAFNIPESDAGLLETVEPTMEELRAAVVAASKTFLHPFLATARKRLRNRLDAYAAQSAPRIKPLLRQIAEDDLFVDPEASDKEFLRETNRKIADVETEVVNESADIVRAVEAGKIGEYQSQIEDFLEKLEDFKKADLASFVAHRALVLRILRESLRVCDGKYVREEAIHEMLVPMRRSSGDYPEERANLWLIDERLAFHEFLASDKPLKSVPVLDTKSNARPDVFILNVTDSPMLVSDTDLPPLASITIVEIKRPMRADVGTANADPVEQCFGYLEQIRAGKAQTKDGRPIANAKDAPAFVYILTDNVPALKTYATRNDYREAYDFTGYFRHYNQLNAYVEILSFDGVLKHAEERHRAFFNKIGLDINQLWRR